MFLATRGLPVLLEVGLLIFCLIEAIQTPSGEARNLPRGVWILLILFFPIIGGIAWLVAGRPVAPRRSPEWRTGAGFPEHQRARPSGPFGTAGPVGPVGPDDDPDFLREMRTVNAEQEETLKRWEADLRRREEEQRRRRSDSSD
jgi:Phospholipase_D-nuclease N-terminal